MLIHALDFEGNRDCGIIEYGVATIEDGRIVATHTAICRARADIPATDVRLHGLSFRDTQEQPGFAEHWDMFRGFRQTGLFCAHAAAVERGLLKHVWPYPPESPDFLTGGHAKLADWGPWLDTHALFRHYYPQGLVDYKLGTLVQAFQLGGRLDELVTEHCPPNRRKPHCALFDAIASALLLVHIMQEPGLQNLGLAELLSASGNADIEGQGELF